MTSIEKLIRIFSEFPGIGPKQAKRFVYFLLSKNNSYIEEFKKEITDLKSFIRSCSDCKKYFSSSKGNLLCDICADDSRDGSLLMIVGLDSDLNTIEKSGSFTGKYFVLGGLVPVLDKNPEKRIRMKELLSFVSKMAEKGLKEIILGLDANAEGEYTTGLVRTGLLSIAKKYDIKISELGRGLSTGTELEYSDPETIKNALRNRN